MKFPEFNLFIFTYGFDSMTDTHNEFMLFSHFSDEFIWSKSLIKCFAEHFRSTIQCTTKTVTLNLIIIIDLK